MAFHGTVWSVDEEALLITPEKYRYTFSLLLTIVRPLPSPVEVISIHLLTHRLSSTINGCLAKITSTSNSPSLLLVDTCYSNSSWPVSFSLPSRNYAPETLTEQATTTTMGVTAGPLSVKINKKE